jgi:hypothetical protein
VDIQSQLTSGQLARLIPSISDSKKEEKATSIALESFMAVPELAASVLGGIGVSVSKRTKIECYTEVVFKHAAKDEPDNAAGEYHRRGLAGTDFWWSPNANITGICMTQRFPTVWHPFSHDFKTLAYKIAGGL